MPEIQLTQGTVHYRDEGEGPAVVLIHGLLVNGRVWDDVLPRLGTGVRRIVPDLPLGSHLTPMNDGAALDPPALARMIAELVERLDLHEVTLVGNDTGGALCQLVVAHHPERIGKLLLINCDAFENFPPRSFAPALTALRRVPGLLALAADLGRVRWGRRLALNFAPLTLTPIRDELAQSWLSAAAATASSGATPLAVMRGIRAGAHARRGRWSASLRSARHRRVGAARRVLQGPPTVSASWRRCRMPGSRPSRRPARSCSSTCRIASRNSSASSPARRPPRSRRSRRPRTPRGHAGHAGRRNRAPAAA